MYSSGPTQSDPRIQRNPINVLDAYYPTFEKQILPGPSLPQYGNQHDGGIPLDTPWDAYARAYTPDPQALVFGVPNLGAPGRGNPILYPYSEMSNGFMPVFDNFSDWLSFSNASRLIIYVDDLNYQGISPMEIQPQLMAPEPWEIYTPQQRAGGG